MKIKMKIKNKRFIIPVPYVFFHLSIAILTSKRVLGFVNRTIEKKGPKNFQISYISRDDLKPILKELSKERGLLLVETSLKDGTEVSIKL